MKLKRTYLGGSRKNENEIFLNYNKNLLTNPNILNNYKADFLFYYEDLNKVFMGWKKLVVIIMLFIPVIEVLFFLWKDKVLLTPINLFYLLFIVLLYLNEKIKKRNKTKSSALEILNNYIDNLNNKS